MPFEAQGKPALAFQDAAILRTWGAPFEAQGKAVLRPYKFVGEWEESGGVESKPRDLGSDRGYRVANFGIAARRSGRMGSVEAQDKRVPPAQGLEMELCGVGVRSSIGGGLNGDVQAGFVVRAADDAEEFWVHGGGGAVPDAGHRSHDRHIHSGECGSIATASLLASGAARSCLHRVSDVPEWRAAAILDFGAGIFRFAEGHEFVGDARRVGHYGHEPGRQT
jgi:hypothetical protein